jgi:hypothetical protein
MAGFKDVMGRKDVSREEKKLRKQRARLARREEREREMDDWMMFGAGFVYF